MKNFKTFIKESDLISEKNKPTSPEKWARAKASAKSKFAVYPSAYANAWASKKYKSMGGGWRSESESVTEDGMSGVAIAGPTNTVGTGAIAGTGGKGGEPGVSRNRNPVMINIRRRPPKI
jgi:hypothetical protein